MIKIIKNYTKGYEHQILTREHIKLFELHRIGPYVGYSLFLCKRFMVMYQTKNSRSKQK